MILFYLSDMKAFVILSTVNIENRSNEQASNTEVDLIHQNLLCTHNRVHFVGSL